QRTQTTWRGVLVCVCQGRRETDQALSGQKHRSGLFSVGASCTGTLAQSAGRSVTDRSCRSNQFLKEQRSIWSECTWHYYTSCSCASTPSLCPSTGQWL